MAGSATTKVPQPRGLVQQRLKKHIDYPSWVPQVMSPIYSRKDHLLGWCFSFCPLDDWPSAMDDSEDAGRGSSSCNWPHDIPDVDGRWMDLGSVGGLSKKDRSPFERNGWKSMDAMSPRARSKAIIYRLLRTISPPI